MYSMSGASTLVLNEGVDLTMGNQGTGLFVQNGGVVSRTGASLGVGTFLQAGDGPE
jgi:hypothetical protein